MKTKLFLSIAVMSCFVLNAMSCGSDDNGTTEEVVTMTVSPESIVAGSDASTVTVTVNCNKAWTVLSNPTWCTPSKSGGLANGDNITFTITENSTVEQRTGEIVLKSGTTFRKTISVTQNCPSLVTASTTAVSVGGQAQTTSITITSNISWSITSDASWCTVSPASLTIDGVSTTAQTTAVTLTIAENTTSATRNATLSVKSESSNFDITVEQMSDAIVTPTGYTLVWHDEFNDPRQENGRYAMPDTEDWYYETGASGWGNNELQNYVAGVSGTDTVAVLKDGMMNIILQESGSQYISARINTNQAWTYGYFEMRAKLPKGKGAWPAFWMMPKNYTSWPGDGEIDIMEGYYTGRVSSAIHCTQYYGGNCKTTSTMNYSDCQDTFHVYALEWTSTSIKTYVDGTLLFQYNNDGGGTSTWPFDAPFYLKLNLAWGGNWTSGEHDDTALPATYIIDYVRVFQK